MEKVRFAPIIRVSTEQQKQKGSSLQTQSKQIRTYVSMIPGGIISDHCWKYTGQEHATPDYERKLLDQLLQDSSRDLFDAVMVCDTSRWSRDNRKNKEGLEILRNNGIRFFVGTMEYDLYNPEHNFMLGMAAETGELQARQGALKSIVNRIERAKAGIPTSGRLPFGRTFDKKTSKWGIDQIKKQLLEKAAESYIAGEDSKDIEQAFGYHFRFLHTTMMYKSGTTWTIHFNKPDLNIDETVTLEVPRLLEEDVISTNRQSIDWEHPEMEKLRDFLSGIVAQVNTDWRKQRKEQKDKDLKEKTGIDTKIWVATMPDDIKANASQIIEALGGEDALEKFTPVIKALHEIVPVSCRVFRMEDVWF